MKKLIFPALLLLTSPASALLSTYDWNGIVTNSGRDIKAGDTVRGTLTLDDSIEADPGDPGTYLSAKLSIWTGGKYYERTSYYPWSVYKGSINVSNHTMDGDEYVSMDFGVASTAGSVHDIDKGFTGGGWGVVVGMVDENGEPGLDNYFGDVTRFSKRQDFASIVDAGGDSEPVPEPSSMMLMASALAAFGLYRRRRS